MRRLWSFKVDIFDHFETPNGSNRWVQNFQIVLSLGRLARLVRPSFRERNRWGPRRSALRSPLSQ